MSPRTPDVSVLGWLVLANVLLSFVALVGVVVNLYRSPRNERRGYLRAALALLVVLGVWVVALWMLVR